MKNINRTLGLMMLASLPFVSHASDMLKTAPDAERSEIIAIDAVGDMLGDSGEIGVIIKDAHGKPVEGVMVVLNIENGAAKLTKVSGITDVQGKFGSWLFSNVQTVATISATIDTDNDGKVDTKIKRTEQIAFIDSLVLNNGVGINIETPDDSAVLHVFSGDRGVLIPRVALQGCSDKVTILDPALSLLVFNTNGSDSLDIGYVYFDGADWRNFRFQ
jgi:hypothetical protein